MKYSRMTLDEIKDLDAKRSKLYRNEIDKDHLVEFILDNPKVISGKIYDRRPDFIEQVSDKKDTFTDGDLEVLQMLSAWNISITETDTLLERIGIPPTGKPIYTRPNLARISGKDVHVYFEGNTPVTIIPLSYFKCDLFISSYDHGHLKLCLTTVVIEDICKYINK